MPPLGFQGLEEVGFCGARLNWMWEKQPTPSGKLYDSFSQLNCLFCSLAP